VLPLCFVRIRRYGFVANRVRQEKPALCRLLLGVEAASEPLPVSEEPVEGQTTADLCPSCGKGRMVIMETLWSPPTHREQWAREATLEQAGIDTS
jgi:hypothetical protein